MEHSRHEIESSGGFRRILSRRSEILQDEGFRNQLTNYLQFSSLSKGDIMKACILLNELFPSYYFVYRTVLNALLNIQKKKKKSVNLLKHME